ncbi:MAG: hypothetical protein SGPRY_013843 [Prymnesium sp.]
MQENTQCNPWQEKTYDEVCWEPVSDITSSLPTDELPLNQSWSSLRALPLGGASLRKMLYRVWQHPLALLPLGVASWLILPVLSDLDTFARLTRPQADLDTGILVGTVISVLRDRQQNLREELFSEMATVETCVQQHVKLFRRDKPRLRRSMELLCAYLDEKRDLLMMLRNYDVRISSSKKKAWSRYWDRQQRRSLAILDVLAEMGDGMMAGPRYGFALFNSLAALEKCESLMIELNERRSKWRASLETIFPPSLYLTIITLMLALVLCFVVRSSAVASGQLLAEKVVRLLFSMMTVSFAALLQIMSDLSDPFSGAYTITDLGPEAVDVAYTRARGALALSNMVEPLDATVDDSAIRPAMELDDMLAKRLVREQNRGLRQ